jgi:uncharacterized small protein (DUF1192 family)
MPDMQNWILLLGSAGVGSAIMAFFQWLASRGKNSQDFQVKRAELENHREATAVATWKDLYMTADAKCEKLEAKIAELEAKIERLKAERREAVQVAKANNHLADALNDDGGMI